MPELANPLDVLIEGYQIIDFQYRFVSVNAAAAEHGHSTARAMLGHSMLECFPGVERRPWFAALKNCLERRVPEQRPNITYFLDQVAGNFKLNIEPTPEGVCLVSFDGRAGARDEAELRGAQDRLRQSDRIEAVGMLALGIAHDINNFMSVITAHGELALQKPLGPGRDALASMLTAARRASVLTTQMLRYGGDRAVDSARFDPIEVLRDLESMLVTTLGPRIKLLLDLPSQIGTVNITASKLEQIVMNLVLNARDALAGGGTIRISASEIELDASRGLLGPGHAAGPYVVFTVSDDGVGMNADTRSHVLEPFYTTKTLGHGTGHGLAVVSRIVTQGGGLLGVESTLGCGSTFKVHLPRGEPLDAPSVVEARPLAPVSLLVNGETVLLAEDDGVLRAIASTALSQAGYRVLLARSGDEALRMCQSDPTIDLLVTDVVMPGMDGLELIDTVRLTRPDLTILCTSGFDSQGLEHHGFSKQVALLEKPYPPGSLVRAVSDLLRRHSVS